MYRIAQSQPPWRSGGSDPAQRPPSRRLTATIEARRRVGAARSSVVSRGHRARRAAARARGDRPGFARTPCVPRRCWRAH